MPPRGTAAPVERRHRLLLLLLLLTVPPPDADASAMWLQRSASGSAPAPAKTATAAARPRMNRSLRTPIYAELAEQQQARVELGRAHAAGRRCLARGEVPVGTDPESGFPASMGLAAGRCWKSIYIRLS
ncbi:hypothetical protein BRADI_3g02028v3 [Brachypodium distachyon]|uniref:Uncharacterized protein n=1 Tax=Brachypodium distachyon TaxID=15368 RepID=A0A0Q3F004_BRADI|nr:hypothetical protein BRADI_3g02028v3 [Brachypodium distachyon]